MLFSTLASCSNVLVWPNFAAPPRPLPARHQVVERWMVRAQITGDIVPAGKADLRQHIVPALAELPGLASASSVPRTKVGGVVALADFQAGGP